MNTFFQKGILLILYIFLFSCYHSNNTGTINKLEKGINTEQKKVKWLAQWYGEGRKEVLIKEISRGFSFLNQSYNIELEFPHEMLKMNSRSTTVNSLIDSICGMIKTDSWPYDIMLCDVYMYRIIAEKIGDINWGRKHLVDFQKEQWYVNSHKETIFDSEKYVEKFGGIAPGAFIEGVWYVLFTSSPVEEELGLKVRNHNMTIDDFISYAKAVSEYNNSNNDKITFLWHTNSTPTRLLSHFVLSVLGKSEANNNSEAFNILNHVYEKLEELGQYKPLKQYTTFESNWDLQHNKILFCYNASWISLLWQKANPEGEKLMHLSELPAISESKAVLYPGYYNAVFVVPQKAKNKEGAKQIMKYICSQEIAEKWVKYSKCPTGLRHNDVYTDFHNDEIDQFSKLINEKYDNNLDEVHRKLNKILFGTDEKINFYARELLNGSLTANEALEMVRDAVEK